MKTILLIDDHEIVRIGLKKLLADAFAIITCGEAASSKEAMQLASQREWDLVVLELSLERNSGLQVLKEIKRIQPKAAVLVLSLHAENQYAFRAIKAGAAGFVAKGSPAAELLQAVKQVIKGGRYVSPALGEILSIELQRDDVAAIHERLSNREFQVMRMIGSGRTVGEIAQLLSISDKTVSTYRARLLEKTGLRNNAELVRYVVENHFAD